MMVLKGEVLRLIAVIMIILSISVSSHAANYKWTDDKDVLHFSDTPPEDPKYSVRISPDSSESTSASGTAANKLICSKDVICVKTVKYSDHIDAYIVNKNPFVATVSLTMDLENMKSSRLFPITDSYKGNSETKVVRLNIADNNLKWNYKYTFSWILGDINAKHDDSVVYSFPYQRGTSHKVTQGFNGEFSHNGASLYAVDFAMPEGTPVYSARDGIVIDSTDSFYLEGTTDEFKSAANYVLIQHADGTIALYGHLLIHGAIAKVGTYVAAHTMIGISGNTGFSRGPHLHFEVYKLANGGTKRVSVPIRFRTSNGVIGNPQVGQSYEAM